MGTAHSVGAPTEGALHFLWIVDCSDAMKGYRIQSVNQTIRDAIPCLQRLAEYANPLATVRMRALAFASQVFWHVKDPTPVKSFVWPELNAGGQALLGTALRTVAEELRLAANSSQDRLLRPVLVLISASKPTDDFEEGLRALLAEPLGQKAMRIGVAPDDCTTVDCLESFTADTQRGLVRLGDFCRELSAGVRICSGVTESDAATQHGERFPIRPVRPPSAGDLIGDIW